MLPSAISRDIEMDIPYDSSKETAITMERDLVSTTEEKDMEALLDTYVPWFFICMHHYLYCPWLLESEN